MQKEIGGVSVCVCVGGKGRSQVGTAQPAWEKNEEI